MLARSRRLATALTLALAAGGTALAAAGPAQALPIGCTAWGHQWSAVPGVSVSISYYLICTNGNEEPWYVALDKNGVKVASGNGYATYSCSGTAESTFTSTGNNTGSFQAACG
jgi:hypothetical protein